jgi:hypothetical protein
MHVVTANQWEEPLASYAAVGKQLARQPWMLPLRVARTSSRMGMLPKGACRIRRLGLVLHIVMLHIVRLVMLHIHRNQALAGMLEQLIPLLQRCCSVSLARHGRGADASWNVTESES